MTRQFVQLNKGLFYLYFSEFIVVIVLLFYYNFGFYYNQLLHDETKIVLLILASLYLLIILPFRLLSKGRNETIFKSDVLLNVLKQSINQLMVRKRILDNIDLNLTKGELNAVLFFLVKIIFIPIMLNFFIAYLLYLIKYFQSGFSFEVFFTSYNWFFIISAMIFTVDTFYFSFGYIVESKGLNNQVKSVDATAIGWIAALACYKPFNNVTVRLFPMLADENIYFINDSLTTVIYILVLVFYFTYLWATLALGAKCSNLTNRGIVSKGPYQYVRHPAYISKLIAWWLLCIPILDLKVLLSMSGWTLIYLVRVYTEEKHLSKDTDYLNYCSKVKYRLIPGIY